MTTENVELAEQVAQLQQWGLLEFYPTLFSRRRPLTPDQQATVWQSAARLINESSYEPKMHTTDFTMRILATRLFGAERKVMFQHNVYAYASSYDSEWDMKHYHRIRESYFATLDEDGPSGRIITGSSLNLVPMDKTTQTCALNAHETAALSALRDSDLPKGAYCLRPQVDCLIFHGVEIPRSYG